jgi:hypothetical protein
MLPTARVAWIAGAAALSLHAVLALGQGLGWIPGEGRWLKVGAIPREWRIESALGAIERYRAFGEQWLEGNDRPMPHEEFLNRQSRAWSAINRALDVRWSREPHTRKWFVAPEFEEPFRRYDQANGRYSMAVAESYEGKAPLSECRAAWAELKDALNGLRRAVERSR